MANLDRLSTLPPEILANIALTLPLTDVHHLCTTSQTLSKLCNNDMFWARRLAQDYPQFVRDRSLGAQDNYFRAAILNIPGTFTLASVAELMLRIGTEPVDILSFVYPLPPWSVHIKRSRKRTEGCFIQADVAIAGFQNDLSNYAVISWNDRVPLFGDLPKNYRALLNELAIAPDAEHTEQIRSIAQSMTYSYPHQVIVSGIYLPRILQELEAEGYIPSTLGRLHIPLSCAVIEENADLFSE